MTSCVSHGTGEPKATKNLIHSYVWMQLRLGNQGCTRGVVGQKSQKMSSTTQKVMPKAHETSHGGVKKSLLAYIIRNLIVIKIYGT